MIAITKNTCFEDCKLSIFKMAAGAVVMYTTVPIFYGNSEIAEENKCKCYYKLKEELLRTKEKLLSMKEIVNILDTQLKTSDAEIRPTGDTQSQHEEEWITVKHRRNTTEVRKVQQQAIPVMVNRFVLTCVNSQASIKEENPETSENSSRPKPRRRKVQVLGDSHARGYAQLIREKVSNNFKVGGFVKPNGRSKNVVDTNITNMTNNGLVVLRTGTNDIAKNCTDEGLNSIVKFIQDNKQTNVLVLEAPHRHDLVEWSCVSQEVKRFNRKLGKRLKLHEHVRPVFIVDDLFVQ
ncbi:hypothetical protein ANN_27789 [Periplaneta americana]|uniref:Uncharacterized protein n=1 Tax=Periplaneta americana TaxID=6978 RepID=A0ABQ8RV52_PERAM|nr:hypothetical protein ANN_27789 [Periplaneta americana]